MFLDNNDENTPMHEQGDVEQESAPSGELVTCKADRDAWKEKYMRVQADLDNFTKRVDKERIQWRTSGQVALLLDIINVADDIDRAAQLLQKAPATPEMQPWVTGFDMLQKSFNKFLDKHEVKEIPAALPFDPTYHEALVQVESPEHTSGDIVGVLQRGFTFKEQVLRPAKVSVAK